MACSSLSGFSTSRRASLGSTAPKSADAISLRRTRSPRTTIRSYAKDFAPLCYDSGNYEPILDKALAMVGYESFLREEQRRLRAQGRYLGIGIAAYVEAPASAPMKAHACRCRPTAR